MGLRETMNNNPAAVTGGAVVVLLLALGFAAIRGGLFSGGGRNIGTAQIIYYDVANKQIKLVPTKMGEPYPNSPLDGSPETYQATVFACGECPEGNVVDGLTLADLEAKGMYIGWLQKRDPGTEADPSFNPSVMYRAFKGGSWVSGSDSRWYTTEDKIQRQCPGGAYAMPCYAPLIK